MPKTPRSRRVVIISDMHCGHVLGLTPPQFDAEPNRSASDKRKTLFKTRRVLWSWYAERLAALKPIDVLIWNGDAVDGTGSRSGGIEQITPDRTIQTDMASECILAAAARKVYGTYGTAYHTGEEEDWEDLVAYKTDTIKLGSHEWIDVNGLVFDCKHHLSSSAVPHGRHTAVSREHLWNLLWSEHGESPKGDVYIRSHVHYFNHCGGYKWLALTTPALQGLGSKYGARRCSGTVDYGFLVFDVVSKENFTWAAQIAKFPVQNSNVLKA